MANKDQIPTTEVVQIEDPAPIKTPVSVIGKFVIKQAKDESYMFNLKASNGEVIATSDMYSSLDSCRKGIASVQLNAPIANFEDHTVKGAIEEAVNPKFELYFDKSGDYRFRLKAKNGTIIAKSQGYTDRTKCLAGIKSVRKNAMSDAIDESAIITEPTPILGKYIIKQAKDESYMFNLKATNGEVIATSDMYSSLEKCKKGIASVRTNAPIADVEDQTVGEETTNPKFELYQDKSGEYRFRLKAKNGSIIAKSQGYASKTNCKNGIESVRKNALAEDIITE